MPQPRLHKMPGKCQRPSYQSEASSLLHLPKKLEITEMLAIEYDMVQFALNYKMDLDIAQVGKSNQTN